MGFINKYPYTDFHELNLDWVIAEIRKLHTEWSDFKILNQIRFDGQWDITKQYPAWTLVNDNNMGYISKKPVPAGIDLENTEYWGLVADYSALLADMQNRIISLENRATDIEEDVEDLSIKGVNRHVILIGDSYADPNRGGKAHGWFTTFETFSGLIRRAELVMLELARVRIFLILRMKLLLN